MDMEKETWIENILNSTNGITQMAPDDDLFSKIRQGIKQQEAVSPKTFWLVAASIAALVILNVSVISTKSKPAENPTTAYLEMTVNKNNQLYQ
jgi:hypothetical protein